MNQFKNMWLNYKTAWVWFLGLMLLIIALLWLDQWTKQWITDHMIVGRRWAWLAFLDITHIHNTGSAFGLFKFVPPWGFALLAGVVSVGLLIWAWQSVVKKDYITAIGLALVVSGALGNGIDRMRLGYVVDFIYVHIKGWYWPAFNIADSAISIGVVLLLLLSFRKEPNKADVN